MNRKLHTYGLFDKCEAGYCNNVASTIAYKGVSCFVDDRDTVAVCPAHAKQYIYQGYNVVMTYRLYRGSRLIATSYHSRGLLTYYRHGDRIIRVTI